MDKNYDFPPFGPYGMGYDMGNSPDDMFNPMMQYEQGYMYYRFMCMQLEYKIKQKELERLSKSDTKERRIE